MKNLVLMWAVVNMSQTPPVVALKLSLDSSLAGLDIILETAQQEQSWSSEAEAKEWNQPENLSLYK